VTGRGDHAGVRGEAMIRVLENRAPEIPRFPAVDSVTPAANWFLAVQPAADVVVSDACRTGPRGRCRAFGTRLV